MTTKNTIRSNAKKQAEVLHPGMMGDGTEEQDLNERGNPGGRIKKDEVEAVFRKQSPKKQSPNPTDEDKIRLAVQAEGMSASTEDVPRARQLVGPPMARSRGGALTKALQRAHKTATSRRTA